MKKLMILIGLTLILSACSGNGSENEPIVVSGKNWTEQYILSQILAIYIEENTDYTVDLQDGLGEVAILTPALEKGEIDMYIEYTGTGLEAVLNEQAEEGESSESILNRVRQGYEETYDATWLEPLGFENNYTLAYLEDATFNADTYSDVAAISEDLSFGAPHAFYERQGDGYDAFAEAYDFNFATTESFDPNVMYKALLQGDVDVIPAFTTDGRIQRENIQTTADDLGFFPKYDAAIVIRQEVLDNYSGLEEALNGLAGQITEQEMQALNAKVDLDNEESEAVAREFLEGKGLING
ncbi:glycine/betaine ABC transporter substrate-binding protein [Aquibacillus koreensis]|uniref:Glycine/betaine ABC transporter substrate-binding protein n=1 Tax=Aquibacillus koreensis TaxID=279446 RepID=A0A9X4AK50_9BACI|nr:glycine betaine ABC transporter substrate-binding protein [Aquibacillus koreensis]MCT2535231.1 glycine/betaine ABC transporter substrate-binding protein [Aquibacillus koreensis]MDC3421090.1 glycine/betaine ABC transporter substrate-binding protein [Aquibacillus koreensis]